MSKKNCNTCRWAEFPKDVEDPVLERAFCDGWCICTPDNWKIPRAYIKEIPNSIGINMFNPIDSTNPHTDCPLWKKRRKSPYQYHIIEAEKPYEGQGFKEIDICYYAEVSPGKTYENYVDAAYDALLLSENGKLEFRVVEIKSRRS